MPTLMRSDGTQFVMQAHRELLSVTKKKQMVQVTQLLAEQRGEHVRLFRKGRSQYEAIFSKEPGCLFGESIWYYFNKPDNLIYCEALPDSAQVLLVVVRSGVVCMDMRILGSSLQSKLLPLMTGDIKYRIITSGSVPLRKAESFGMFRFPKDLVASFEKLEDLVFPRLPVLQSLQLQPLPRVLKSERLGFNLLTSTVIIAAVILVLGGWWLLTPKKIHTSSYQQILSTFPSSYTTTYTQILAKPTADKQLTDIIATINRLYVLPGWRMTTLSFDGQRYHINIISDGGDINLINQWAKQQHYQLHLTSEGAELVYKPQITPQRKQIALHASEKLVIRLVARIDKLLAYQAVSLGASQRQGDVRKTQLTIRLESVSPEVLDLVNRELKHLPLELTSVDIYLRSGLMNGTIQLSAWGR